MRLIVLILLLPTLALGQAVTGNLVGTVTDATDAAVPGVKITAVHRQTGQQTSTVTDDSGQYVLRGLLLGNYSVTAEMQGFKRAVRENAEVLAEEKQRVDFRLEVGEVTQQVVVTAAAPQLLTESTRLETVAEGEQILALPFNGRNFLDVLLLFPGVSEGTESAIEAPDNLSPTGGSSTVSIAGGRIQSNVYLLNGTLNTEGRQNLMAIQPSLDSIEQVSVNRSTNSAEFGRSGAGQVNVVTRAGGKSLHGSVYELFRNDALDARGFFPNLLGQPKEVRRQNQFGATVRGPVVLPRLYRGRERTFFSAGYEGSRIRVGQSGFARVPTERERRADFSEGPRPIYDPLTTDPVTGARQPFGGNQISANRISPVAQRVLEFYPLPNIPLRPDGYNYYNAPTQVISNNQIYARLDHRLSDRDTLTGIYFFNQRPFSDPRSALPGQFDARNVRAQNLSLSYHRIFGPRAFNEARVGFNRTRFGLLSPNAYKEDIAGRLGIGGVDRTPVNYGLPVISILGQMADLDDTTTAFRRNNTFQYVDNFSLVRGRHGLRMGAEIRRSQVNNREDRGSRGSFTFSGVYTARLTVTASSVTPVTNTGVEFADFLLGFPSRTRRAVGEPLQSYLRSTSSNFYINDDWKVTPRLTVNVGLRYELTPPYHDRYDHLVNVLIAPGFQKFVKVKPGDKNPFSGETAPPALVNTDHNNLAPRLGLAYRLFPKTVMRLGYGIFYNTPPADITIFNLTNQQPLVFTQSVNFDQASQPRRNILLPTLTLADGFSGPLGSFTSFGIEDGMRTGYSQQWNFNLQHQLRERLVVEAAYVGSLSLKLEQQVAHDRPVQRRNPDGTVTLLPPVSMELWPPGTSPGGALMSMGGGASNYHALQLSANQRYQSGLQFLASYTWGKSIDNSSQRGGNRSSAGTAQNSFDLRNERGLSSFDVRHRLVMSYSYELPFGRRRPFLSSVRGWLGPLVGGWELSGINTFSSGTPRTARTNTSLNLTGTFSAAERADATGLKVTLPRDRRTIEHFFNTAAFGPPQLLSASPLLYAFGSAGRNIIIAPGRTNFDLALTKNTYFAESRYVQLRGEFFNVFNITNFGLGSQSAALSNGQPNPAFGRIGFTQPHRKVQLTMRVVF